MCKTYTLALKKFSVFNNYLFKEQLTQKVSDKRLTFIANFFGVKWWS